MSTRTPRRNAQHWSSYYRQSRDRPPRELLRHVLDHVDWEGGASPGRTAVDLGSGAGTESLEMLRRGWRVLAVDKEVSAARFLVRRTPVRFRSRLTAVVSPMEGLSLPAADLVFASFSLPFCDPKKFPGLWTSIRRAIRPGGHFAGVLFGDADEWSGNDEMSFHGRSDIARLGRGWKVELLRETVEEGRCFKAPDGWRPKHWHYFEVILEKPRLAE